MLPAPAATDDGAIAVGDGGQSPTGGDPSAPGVAVEIILDTSDSMNESDQGSQTRLEIAKDVATRLVTDTLPPGVPMALRTYSGCSTSLAIPMQPLDPTSATSTIAGLTADGSTPIEKSLRAAAADLAGISGPKIIMLVTDGEETCNGDPRAAIADIVAQNITVQVNIVGFAIDNSWMTATFQDWAAVGHGKYYEASDKIELDQAETAASQLPFHVLDQQDTVIADGVVGGDSVSVPAGTYTVEIDTSPVTRKENVVVTTGKTTAVDLDTGDPPSSPGASNVDLMSFLPSQTDIPDGLVSADSRTRTLDEVVTHYANPELARQNFTAWGWKGNAIASFTLPGGQSAQSGVLNGVYVSIHEFDSPEHAKAALDFSLTEQQSGQPLDEVDVGQFGEYSRGLYGLLDYGYETTILAQQGNVLIRVSAAELDGDPTAKTQAITSTMLANLQNGATSSTTGTTALGAETSSGSGSTRTWPASVQVALCDAPPNSGQAMNCHGEAGVVVNISLASGESLGSCTSGDPVQFPGGDTVSLCSVDGLPFNADLVATQDPSTIPAGYEPVNNTLTLHVDGLIPGGGDQAAFTFFNVRTDAGSRGTSGTSSSTGSESATLAMTFRGCREGFDPTAGDFYADCTVPLDAPDASVISWSGGSANITELSRRDYDGAYIYTGSSGTLNVSLSGLAPAVRNGYQVFGSDGGDIVAYTVQLISGETREIYVFYYYNP